MEISVVIPVYGCRAALPELHRRLTVTLQKITNEYEIILVNDACPQDSWSVIEHICQDDAHVMGIELSRNFGQSAAITAGLDYSTGDWVVVMDCDLQDKPEEIMNLYRKAMEGYDVVFARRRVRQDRFIKTVLAKCFYKVYSIATGTPYDPALCNLTISNRKIINAYCSMREHQRDFLLYLKWLGFKSTTIDVEHCERYEGKSSYTLKKEIDLALDLLTSQSDMPLKLMACGGIAVAIIAFCAVLMTTLQYFISSVEPGWSSIIASLYLLGGIIVASIGIVGIYVGNIFMEVKNRPLYIVRNTLNFHNHSSKKQEKHEV